MTTTEQKLVRTASRLVDSTNQVRREAARLRSIRNAICCYDLAYPALMATNVQSHDINLTKDGAAHAAIRLKDREIGIWTTPAGEGKTALTIGEKPNGLGVVGRTMLVDTSTTQDVKRTVHRLRTLAATQLLGALKARQKEQE